MPKQFRGWAAFPLDFRSGRTSPLGKIRAGLVRYLPPARADLDLPPAQTRDLLVVGRDQEGRALVQVHLGDQVHHLHCRGAVEVAGRFQAGTREKMRLDFLLPRTGENA